MQRTLSSFLALWLLLASSLHAEIGLNPFSWFSGDDEDIVSLNIASAAEEAEAASMLKHGKGQLEAGSTGSASRTFKKIIKGYPNAKATADARYYRAQIYMTEGRWVKAFRNLQEIIARHPNYENFDQVISSQFDCATALMEGARGRILWIIPGFKQYTEATREFEQIVRNAPYSDYAPLSLMNIAIVSERQDKPEEAIDALDRLINYYPQSMLAPDAYYNMAETYSNLVKGAEYDQGSTRQAISYYEDFLILFPQSKHLGEVESNLDSMEDLLARSQLSLGDFYYNYRSNNTAALVFYNETITIAPESQAAEEARQRIADIEAGVKPTNSASILRKILSD
ncbi:outer membrane protein assembly factor BamD [Coraliomargarita sp. SDUM461004]|uniref:Outer membrane protein assembly factor BamD n=1 Tax=Thalassobacterium sedimentorum TaxID=3041258 RepID=A0ABU1AED5_9BACT|nr:outer membrane protein assembly factor BamD [Coraliomargarita sp. SDUM461004]MDQ8193130.1 outer membrane protein assembly factor BamD [Coraliomargarita sp. SDUM461004]